MSKRFRLACLGLCFALILIPHFVLLSSAQSAPIPVYGPAYTFMEGKALYISGGTTRASNGAWVPVRQFYALDLTATSWNVSNPPWVQKSLSPSADIIYADHVISFSKSQDELVLLNAVGGSVNRFNLSSNSWESSSVLPPSALTTLGDLDSVTDPKTGLMYIPFGFRDAQLTHQMMVYDPMTNNARSVPMPPAVDLPADVAQYSVAWSTVRNSLLLFGGKAKKLPSGYVFNNNLFEYSLGTEQWSIVPPAGDFPGFREDACFIPADNGNTMVLFGGWTSDRKRVSDIYFLNTTFMAWSKGNATSEPTGRSDMACAIAGDNFVAWGGAEQQNDFVNAGIPVIYNLKTHTWTTHVGPEPLKTTTTSITPSSPTAKDEPKSAKSSLGIILGGLAGGTLFVLVTLLLVYRWTRSGASRKPSRDTSTDEDETVSKISLQQFKTKARRLQNENGTRDHRLLNPQGAHHPYIRLDFKSPQEVSLEQEAHLFDLSSQFEQQNPQQYPYDPSLLGHPHAVMNPLEQYHLRTKIRLSELEHRRIEDRRWSRDRSMAEHE